MTNFSKTWHAGVCVCGGGGGGALYWQGWGPSNIGPNCPGISGTVTDFFAQSRIPDSFIVPEVEERHAIEPLVAQALVSY